MADRLNGKVAVVTGAASGMGKAIAMDFLKEGAKVLATDMNEVRLAELIEDCEDEELPVENLVTLVGNITMPSTPVSRNSAPATFFLTTPASSMTTPSSTR